ncbi:nucleosome assembly protein 1-like 1 [Centruroides vittatus]|uniref:nucleosome assembly protein 1-like 1 n=1 Tax=Centruroides vittatus TaxID=120091 RepID=UPI00351049AF
MSESIEIEPNPIPAEASSMEKLQNFIHEKYSSLFCRSVDQDVHNRVLELKNLQIRYFENEVNYYKELQQLKVKYADIQKSLFESRFRIINGIGEGSADTKEEAGRSDEEINYKKSKGNENSGIPNFWLTVFRNSKLLSSVFNEEDEMVLKHLKDVAAKYVSDTRMDFVLEFHFEPNEYFSNSVLTKEYGVKCEVDPEELYNFGGPEIVRCEGCVIEWKDGKDITRSTVKKGNEAGEISETVRNDSFFNFFLPKREENVEVGGRSQVLESDYEIGKYIKEKIIPRAVLYYTGEMEESFDSEDESSSY